MGITYMIDEVKALFDLGHTYKDIAKTLNVSRHKVADICKSLGLVRSVSEISSIKTKSILDDPVIIEDIREKFKTMTAKEIAVEYKSSHSSVMRIIKKYNISDHENTVIKRSKKVSAAWDDAKKEEASLRTRASHPKKTIVSVSKRDSTKCRDCGCVRGTTEFIEDKNLCKSCYADYHAEYRRNNSDLLKLKSRTRYINDPVKVRKSISDTHHRSPRLYINNLFRRISKPCRQNTSPKQLNPVCKIVEIDSDYLFDIYNNTNGLCMLSNTPMIHHVNNLCSISIDRIDSSIGYVEGNIQLTCKWVNLAKSNYDTNTFLELLNRWYDYINDDSIKEPWICDTRFLAYKLRCLRSKSNAMIKKYPHHLERYQVQIGFDDIESLWDEQRGFCALSGMPLTQNSGYLCTLSIDRIDSSIGYLPGNVQLTCRWANIAKGTHSNEEFMDIKGKFLRSFK